jgi:hypothetical protein
VITDYIIILVFLIMACVCYKGDMLCYKEWRGIHYKHLVISYAVPIEIVGLSSVLVFAILVETIAKLVWIFTCILCLSILAIEVWRVRK